MLTYWVKCRKRTENLKKRQFASSTNTSLISVSHVENGAQFLNAKYVSFPTFTVISPVTKTNASE